MRVDPQDRGKKNALGVAGHYGAVTSAILLLLAGIAGLIVRSEYGGLTLFYLSIGAALLGLLLSLSGLLLARFSPETRSARTPLEALIVNAMLVACEGLGLWILALALAAAE